MGHSGNWSDWCTQAFHAWKAEMPTKAQKSEIGGQLKIVGKRADGLQSRVMVSSKRRRLVAGDDGFSGSSGSDGFEGLVASSGVDGSDSDGGAACFVDFDGSTKGHQCESPLVAQVVGFNENWRSQKSTTQRETVGSRSPRRADKIDGQRVEGLS